MSVTARDSGNRPPLSRVAVEFIGGNPVGARPVVPPDLRRPGEHVYVPADELRGAVVVTDAARDLIEAWDAWNGIDGEGHRRIVDGLDALRSALGGQ